MNRATGPLLNSQAHHFNLRAICLFHSTPVLDRKRRPHWDSGGGASRNTYRRFDSYSKRLRKLQSKQTLLRNVGAFAEHLFQNWRNDFDESDSSSSRGSSWSRREYGAKDFKRGSTSARGPYSSSKSYFHFCDDDNDVETIFRSTFGGNRFFYWSFIEEDFPHRWQSSSGHQNNYRSSWSWRNVENGDFNYRSSWSWRHRENEDDDSSTESDSSEIDFVSYRLALGLSPSGPLKLDDVKNAYRTCALKWHPDRHQGSSKAAAEEKFKACSAAYQSLCEKMA